MIGVVHSYKKWCQSSVHMILLMCNLKDFSRYKIEDVTCG